MRCLEDVASGSGRPAHGEPDARQLQVIWLLGWLQWRRGKAPSISGSPPPPPANAGLLQTHVPLKLPLNLELTHYLLLGENGVILVFGSLSSFLRVLCMQLSYIENLLEVTTEC